MASQKLTHETFWNRMDRATRHVGKLPDWVKGSPNNERSASSGCGQFQRGPVRSDNDPAAKTWHDPQSARR
jgi:hypothetical protein